MGGSLGSKCGCRGLSVVLCAWVVYEWRRVAAVVCSRREGKRRRKKGGCREERKKKKEEGGEGPGCGL